MIDLSLVTEVLSNLVGIESVNPDLVPGGSGEEAIARHLLGILRSAGLQVQLQEVSPGRLNAIGVLRGNGGGRSLMLNGHLDIDPIPSFSPALARPVNFSTICRAFPGLQYMMSRTRYI